jgi:hypothetical protein
MTGVTNFSLMGLSGGANQMQDLSLAPEYAAIFGFTADELDPCFADRYPGTLAALKGYGVLPGTSGWSICALRSSVGTTATAGTGSRGR